ncbi:MAG: hypothetical protein NTZ74_12085 [Chloroflexi bacterium]|nr:hypothetical protein [Chloroflexota bacterium]
MEIVNLVQPMNSGFTKPPNPVLKVRLAKRKVVAVSLVILLLLSSCERPATITNWSPINSLGTASPEEQRFVIEQATQTATNELFLPSSAVPTLDLSILPATLPSSMKGYELMSWQVDDQWSFTLITGTNREKTFEEIMDPGIQLSPDGFVKITVNGIDQIKKAFDHLAVEEQIFWGGMDLAGQVPAGTLYFTFPPQEIVDELTTYCKERNISLSSLQEPK